MRQTVLGGCRNSCSSYLLEYPRLFLSLRSQSRVVLPCTGCTRISGITHISIPARNWIHLLCKSQCFVQHMVVLSVDFHRRGCFQPIWTWCSRDRRICLEFSINFLAVLGRFCSHGVMGLVDGAESHRGRFP